MDRKKITRLIKEKALKIGFDLVGITSAEPFSRAYNILLERKKEGFLSEFTHQDIKLLTTPELHLPGVKSIISLALSYAVNRPNYNSNFYISTYALGRDYHIVIKNKMKVLINYIKELKSGFNFKLYTDTGPLLDREVAYRAGIGWIGKNNNLINPDYGSYLFLGEILIDFELDEDMPMKNRCNSCNKCLNNCPTGALKEPYFIQPDLCISYLTQKKGILLEKEFNNIGNNLWGCDRCQIACPYNQNIPVNIHDEFKPKIKGNLEVLDFNKKNIPLEWRKSALSWRGLRILQRNILINMGNSKNKRYESIVTEILENPSPILRITAAWALEKISPAKYSGLLAKMYKKERDFEIKMEIEKILKNR